MSVALPHLKLFIDIARERSITRGAEKNGVSQSAVSQHIHELERVFEIKLLDRGTRPLQLTEAGRLYLDYCRDALRRREEFDVALESCKRRIEGAVRVACIYSIGLSEMSGWEEQFHAAYPDAELTVEFLRPERIYEAVLNGTADLGLVSYPEANRNLTVRPWREDVMLVAARPDHPLADNVFLSPRQLAGAEFIGFDEDLPIDRELRRYFREHGVSIEPILRFDNVVMIKEAVALGSGISILPERVLAEDITRERLVGIPLESPGLYRPVGIIHRRRRRFNRAIDAFLRLLDLPAVSSS